MVVADAAAVAKNDGVFLGEDLRGADVVGVSSVHIEGELRIEEIIGFRDLLLLIDVADGCDLVDILIEDDHDFVVSVNDLGWASGLPCRTAC